MRGLWLKLRILAARQEGVVPGTKNSLLIGPRFAQAEGAELR